jgi:hypothetical protein
LLAVPWVDWIYYDAFTIVLAGNFDARSARSRAWWTTLLLRLAPALLPEPVVWRVGLSVAEHGWKPVGAAEQCGGLVGYVALLHIGEIFPP